jgi:pimeloyl-ACP methyl ester carboxylesterase
MGAGLRLYGNGETATDYDGIAPRYNRIGANFFVIDYRGYGGSGGFPTFSAMIADAHGVLAALKALLADQGFTG